MPASILRVIYPFLQWLCVRWALGSKNAHWFKTQAASATLVADVDVLTDVQLSGQIQRLKPQVYHIVNLPSSSASISNVDASAEFIVYQDGIGIPDPDVLSLIQSSPGRVSEVAPALTRQIRYAPKNEAGGSSTIESTANALIDTPIFVYCQQDGGHQSFRVHADGWSVVVTRRAVSCLLKLWSRLRSDAAPAEKLGEV